MSNERPEIGKSVKTGGFETNYLEWGDGDHPLVLLHGSGPGVTAFANWRLVAPKLSETRRVLAPDLVGFGYTERPEGVRYHMDVWTQQVVDFLDAMGLEKVDLVGNSFGGGLAIRLAIQHPDRIRKIVLMGSMGISFPITEGLDKVWGYEASEENMAEVIQLFADDKSILTPELAKSRYEASIQPGFQESFSVMFPEPRQAAVEWMASDEEDIKGIPHEALIIHGREDEVIPLDNAFRLVDLIDNAELHVYGHCGHWTQIERASDFATEVSYFLSK